MGEAEFDALGKLSSAHSYKLISTPPPPIPLITVATAMYWGLHPLRGRAAILPARGVDLAMLRHFS